MLPLDKSLRNQLERTVRKAREIAEKAARSTLEQLGVEQASPYSYLSDAQMELRRRLRAHGRQLGDARNSTTKEQEISRLVEEVAYEHWHRMLFARFLAENGLLMYFEGEEDLEGVAVTLAECNELATEQGLADGWEVAARMAERMLPRIFRPDSPVFALTLPPNNQRDLEKLLDELPCDVFTASDSLGWVYQFWQADNKEKINNSEMKIGARELPAVTQLFTEPYMVSFLLDNALGAWWARKRLTEEQRQTAKSEEELRESLSLVGMPLDYLRFVKDEGEAWTPAAGTFSAWPDHLCALKVLDPCCGSGHFLVSAFLMLVPLRMELESLSGREACDAVLRDNLHGLEIDPRCVELAAFALALTAWRFPEAGGYRQLPTLNIACSGLAASAQKEEWLSLAGDNNELRLALDTLHKHFSEAPTLGSLINPAASLGSLGMFSQKWVDVLPVIRKVIDGNGEAEQIEMGVAASGMAEAAKLLSGKYHWVITNVPYLARGKQSDVLRMFCEAEHCDAKNDLATVFLDRCLDFCIVASGSVSLVLPQNWLFLTTYKKFREKLLQNDTWHMLARLGEGGFECSAAAGAFAIMLCIGRGTSRHGNNVLSGIDATAPRKPDEKADLLRQGEVKLTMQAKQLQNPDARVTMEDATNINELLGSISDYGQGSHTGDSPRFILYFWEKIDLRASRDVYWLDSPTFGMPWSGRALICNTPLDSPSLTSQLGCRIHGQNVWGRFGIAVNKMRKLEPIFYTGEVFDDNICPICPHDTINIPAIYCYIQSGRYYEDIRKIDQKLNVTSATIVKVPFDLAYWRQIATEKYPEGLSRPYSDNPTQWIFHGHPVPGDQPLQVAVARLLGYHWPAELDKKLELSDEARSWIARSSELNQLADEDGIVCIPAVRGEAPAAERLLNLLARCYPGQDVQAKVSELLAQADHSCNTLESWLRNKFFSQHCKVFQQRPFVWHVWDGLPDGFAALVNYHKLDRKNLESLTYTYLGDWIQRQKADIAASVDGAADRLAAAETLKKSLELILQGEAPLDIFVRWKSLKQQPIGWDPDINDGVRLNIRPFMSAPDVSKKGAGVLRDKPGIEWNKDRGKDVASAPWYNLGPVYGGSPGDRINDHHLTLAEKHAARAGK